MKPRLLYVTHRVPWPPDRGDRIRTWNLLKFLAERADVDLLCLADEPVSSETTEALQSVTRRLAVIPHSGRLRWIRGAASLAAGRTVTEGLFRNPAADAVIRTWCANTGYSAALASSSGVARYVLPPVARGIRRVWIDLIDVDSRKWLDYSRSSRFPMSLIYGLESRRLRRLECDLAKAVDRLLVVSEPECDVFRSFCPQGPIQAIGNGVDTDYFSICPPTSDPPTADQNENNVQPAAPKCVFVGVLNYLPNADAVVWFADNVWPRLRKRFPSAEFDIVGKHPAPEVAALQDRPGINVVGPVPDVRPYLQRASCVVVPLRIARGVQNKVLEAMSAGRPVVCSPAPLKGLEAAAVDGGSTANDRDSLQAGKHLLKAETTEEWVEAVTAVFEDAALAQELGTAAASWVRTHHRWEQCLSPLQELLSYRPASQPQEVTT
ncbi:MAG: TIGR03087 family PEP-CTERM/XrtA system glycosyltransferase [Planctomycetaceae bacterium]|nr:TIGR03087 family PEP-CTERM/XrtA system glycosyltransferase [Planctomycetaceae bacterium]